MLDYCRELMSFIDEIQKRVKNSFQEGGPLFYAKIPVESHSIKKNNKEIRFNRATGQRFIASNKRVLSAQSHLVSQLRSRANLLHLYKPIECPVWTLLLFWFKDYFTQKGVVSKKLPDLSNLYQLPEDCLQKAGILVDDNQIHSHDLSRRLPSNENLLEIFILKYEDAPWTKI